MCEPLNTSQRNPELRVAAFTTFPQPFQVPVYRHLRTRHGIATDLYCVCVDADRGWGATDSLYPVTGFGREFRLGRLRLTFPPASLLLAVARRRYDAVIISGWERLAHVSLHFLCSAASVPVIVGSDLRSGPGGKAHMKRPWLKKLVRDRILSRILAEAKGALAAGGSAAAYFSDVGFRGAMRVGFFGIDRGQFNSAGRDCSKDRLDLLYCGRFVDWKRTEDIVRALPRLVRRGIPVRLVMVGDGPRRGTVQQLARDLGVDRLVTLLGSLSHSELPRVMRQADALILPSAREPWGVVVIEAAACGMALVVSDQVGAGVDVVRDGQNGYVFSKGDIQGLAASLEKVWQDKQNGRMPEIERVSCSLAERYRFEKCADVYADMIREVVNAGCLGATSRACGPA